VCHGIELPFVFHNIAPFYNYTKQEDILSQDMITYWSNFAKSGNPNNPITPKLVWPSYTISSRPNLKLDYPLSIVSGYQQKYCNFWDSIGYNFGT